MKRIKKARCVLCALLLLFAVMGPAYAAGVQEGSNEIPVPSLTADVDVSERVVSGTNDTYDVTVNMTPENASYTSNVIDENAKADVIFLVDTSYSMDGKKITTLRSSASQFASSLLKDSNDGVRISIINFDSKDSSEVRIPFSSNLTDVQDAIDGLIPQGTTYLQPGLANAQQQFDDNARPDVKKVLVVLGDGAASDRVLALDAMDGLRNAYPNLMIKTIGYEIGTYEEAFFRELAAKDTETGEYYNADTDNLGSVFQDISQQIVTSQVNIKKLTVACPKLVNFDIVPGSLVNPDGLVFDMDQFKNGIIEAEIDAPESGVPLSFSYQIKIDPAAADQNREDAKNYLNYDFKYFYDQDGTEQTGEESASDIAPVFYIDTEAGANGVIDPSLIVGKGANASVTWTPDNGYALDSALLDGTELGDYLSNDFADVSADHLLQVSFAKIVPQPTPAPSVQTPTVTPEPTATAVETSSTAATPATGISDYYSTITVSTVLVLLAMVVIATRLKHKANK